MTSENNRHTRLQKLSDSDFEIVEGEPDIRGWDVKDNNHKQLGEVDELVFDYESRKVRYLVVYVGEDNDYGLSEKKVLVPIGIAELHAHDDEVILNGVTPDQMRALPEYNEDRFDSEHELDVRNVFGGLGASDLINNGNTDKDFYKHGHFDDANLYKNRNSKLPSADKTTIPIINEELIVGKREIETGGIRLRSRIVEREVAEDIKLQTERVHVERTPVNRLATDNDYKEESIEMKEYAEIPTVSREARIVEEILLNKQVTDKIETIKDTVRNTEVDVDKNIRSNKD